MTNNSLDLPVKVKTKRDKYISLMVYLGDKEEYKEYDNEELETLWELSIEICNNSKKSKQPFKDDFHPENRQEHQDLWDNVKCKLDRIKPPSSKNREQSSYETQS